MKKILLSLLLLVGAVSVHATKLFPSGFGDLAGNAQWDSENSILTWTGSWSNSVGVQGLSGDLSAYTSLNFTAEDVEWDETDKYGYRVLVYANGDLQNAASIITLGGYGARSLTWEELGLNADQVKNINRICFAGWGNKGKVKITNVYLYKPFELEFDDTGKAYIYPSDFTANGDVTVDETTGLITITGSGTIKIEFDSPVDFSSVTSISTGAARNLNESCNIIRSDGTKVNDTGWWNSAYNITGLNTGWDDLGSIASITYNYEQPGEVTIEKITITANLITATNGHETNLTAALFHGWSGPGADATIEQENVYGACVLNEASGLPYGDGNVYFKNYADLSKYDKLIVTVASGAPRFCFNRLTDGGQDSPDEASSNMMDINANNGAITWAKERYQTIEGNVYTIDLAKMVADRGFAHLHCIKGANYGNPVVTSMILYKNEAEFDYNIQGSGLVKPSVVDALADENANLYNATGVTGAVKLEAANPNAVILANRADVTGTNVIVDGTCADFAIVDNKPYKYAESFTAASAKQTVTMSAAGFSTTVVPFDAAVPSGLKAYNLVAISGNNITGEEVTSVKAGHPVLLEGAAGTYTFEASDVSVAGSADAVQNGLLTASYAGTEATNGGYVLQSQDGKVAFFTFEGTRTMKPFRAYIPANVNSAAKSLNIVLDESTGITAHNDSNATAIIRYNAAGQKLAGVQKGLNIVKMSNGEVKKVFVK